jgi:hypothetical protein
VTKNDAPIDTIVAQLKMKTLFRGDVISQAINLIERLRDQLEEARQTIEDLENGNRK